MTDETTGRYIIKNIHTHDSKAFPCYDTMCFDVETLCLTATPSPSPSPTPSSAIITSPSPTPTRTLTPTPSGICSDSIRNTLSASNLFSSVGRQGMVYSAPNNKAYVLDSNYTTVKSFVPNSTTLTTEFSWSGTSYLLGYNSTENKLYSWSGAVPYTILIRDLDTNTTSSVVISGVTISQSIGKIEYNSVLNKIYAFSTNQVNIIDGSNDSLTNQVSSATFSLQSVVYNPNNNKLYVGPGGYIYSCSGNTVTLDVTSLPIVSASLISLDVANNIIYLVSSTTVYKIDVATNTTISLTPITGGSWVNTSLRSMIYNPDNGKLYISRYSTSTDGFLGVLNPTTGVFTEIFGDGISQPLYVPTNTIYGITDSALYEFCGSTSIITSPTPTPTRTPTPTPTRTLTPTPTPSCQYLSWTIQQCSSTCSGPCTCVGSTVTTVYTNCSVSELTGVSTVIYTNTSLTNPFIGFFTHSSALNDILESTGSGVNYVCTIGGPC